MIRGLIAALTTAIWRIAETMPLRHSGTRRWVRTALPSRLVHGYCAQLRKFTGALERQFLRLSAVVEDLSSGSSVLLESSRRLLKYSLGQADGWETFRSAVNVIERPMAFNDESLAITDRLDGELGGVGGRIRRLHQHRSVLDAAIAPLKILQTMFRIESASSSPEVQSLFVSLSSEIEDLLGRMATMIASEFTVIADTAGTIDRAVGRLAELRARQLRASGRREEIMRSVNRVREQHELNKATDIDLIRITETIAEKVAGIVSGIQYQDILNQRMEHVNHGLEDIRQRLDGMTGRGSWRDLVFLRDASRVESAQLREIDEIIGTTIDRLASSLNRLADDFGGLGTECVLLHGVESSSAACDGMVQVLLDAFSENLELAESTAAHSQEICTVLEPIRGLLGNLTGSMLELSARIRLIALNAQVQAVQAGAGTGLEVLSGQARSIAAEMDGIVAKIAVELDGLRDNLRTGLAEVECMRDRSRELLDYLRTVGAMEEKQLHEFRDRMIDELKKISVLIAHLQSDTREMADAIDIRSLAVDTVRQVRDNLSGFSASLAERLIRESRRSNLDALAARYTAAGERSAHERAVQNPSAELRPFMTGAAEGSVELF